MCIGTGRAGRVNHHTALFHLLTCVWFELPPSAPPEVDIKRFEQAATQLHGSQDPRQYRAAIDLDGGDLLPVDRYEE